MTSGPAHRLKNGEPDTDQEDEENPRESTIYIEAPVDLRNLGAYLLQQQAELFERGGVDSGTDLVDNEPTEPAAKEDDQK